MRECYKTYAPTDIKLKQILYMNVGSYADVVLRKNITTETVEEIIDGENKSYDRQVADEIFFRVDPNSVSKEDIESNFDKYWAYGLQWEDLTSFTNEEIVSKLKKENAELKQCIVEISSLI